MMWVPLLACLTAGIVSVPKCQRGPGALLGAVRLLAAVPGLCQRRKLPSCSSCPAPAGRPLWGPGGDGRAAAGRWGGGYLWRGVGGRDRSGRCSRPALWELPARPGCGEPGGWGEPGGGGAAGPGRVGGLTPSARSDSSG